MKIRPLHEYERGELAVAILKGLAVGGIIVAVMALPGLAQIFVLFRPKNARERYKIKRVVNNLEKQGLVKNKKCNSSYGFEITKKGQKRLQKEKMEDLKVKKTKKWDRVWRIVIFDIPNTKRGIRNAVNIKLKDMGFTPIQKSTFIVPYECREEIDFLGKYYGVRKNIKYILAKKIDDEKLMRKKFEIS